MPLSALFAVPFVLVAAAPKGMLAPAPFPLTAKSAIVIDAESGKPLFERDADTPRPPASTTKIMTALLLLERSKPGEIVVAPKDVMKVGEASMHLKPGERVPATDLAYALMLRSANDGCYAAAIHLAGSVPKFAAMMNARAREIGCAHTRFANPNGLYDPRHVVSARDLATIAREAMRNPAFAEVVRTQRKIIRRGGGADRLMVNHNKLLKFDPTADGIKTGWTIPSGHTYVGSATRGGHRLITAILDGPNWKQDHLNLLSWGFKTWERRGVARRGEPLGTIPVVGGEPAEATVAEDVTSMVKPGAGAVVLTLPTEPRPGPVPPGSPLGTMRVTDPDGYSREVPLVAAGAVPVVPGVPPRVVSAAGGAGRTGGTGRTARAVRNRPRSAEPTIGLVAIGVGGALVLAARRASRPRRGRGRVIAALPLRSAIGASPRDVA